MIFPGGYGTLDELFESLVLIQTGKIADFPVVLYGRAYWSGLVEWLTRTMLAGGKIAAADLELIPVVDSPAEACKRILARAGRREHEHAAREAARQVYAPERFVRRENHAATVGAERSPKSRRKRR
ncbi:MAG: LOG family protein [Polyangia bacterium]